MSDPLEPPSAPRTAQAESFGYESVESATLVVGPTAASDAGSAPVGSDPVPVDIGEGEDVPAVVAVMIARNPGDHFEEALESIAAQDYPNLSVLVVDAGSTDALTDRIAAVLPDAFVHRMRGDATFTAAANQARTLVTGAAFWLFLHDDVRLDRHCVTCLVEELFRSNAGIVTPKIVRWDDPRRLLQIGMGSDRFGVQVDLVEPDEFDQEQYDAVRDVFVAPSGVQLVRADLFDALGGFDLAMRSLSSDLDLCWRAHTLGARVVAVPDAVAAHLLEHPELGSVDDRRRQLARNRFRTLLVTSTRWSMVRVVPFAVLLLVMEGVYSILAGRRRQAAAAFAAIGWNVSRWGDIRQRRHGLAEIRKVPDSEIHALQVGGSARISGYFRGQVGAGSDRLAGVVGSFRSSLTGDDAAGSRVALAMGAALTVLLVFGSRHLITRGIVAVGQVPDLPSAGFLLREWFGGWRSAAPGGPGNPPTAFLGLGLAKAAFFWGTGVLDLLLILGPLAAGTVGAWRLVRPVGSASGSAVAATAYALNPLTVTMIGAGRWDSLIVWAAAPFLLGSMLRLQGITPYGADLGPPGPGVVARDVPTRLLRLGVLAAAVATFVPAVIPVIVGMTVVLVVAAALSGTIKGLSRLIVGGLVAVVVPVALHGPWSFDVLDRLSWSWIVGPSSPETDFDSMADLLRFAPGEPAPTVLTVGLLVVAGLGLVLARGAALRLAVAGWLLALAAWFVTWSARRGWIDVELPTAEMLLVPAAIGLAMAAGVSTVAQPRARLGWRRPAVMVGIAALVVFSLGGVRSSLDGRWRLPTQGFGDFTELLVAPIDGPSRMLWLADPSVAQIDTLQSPNGTHYAVTEGGRPFVTGRWVPGPYGVNDEIGERLDLAAAGETVRLGRLLAAYGIDLVVVVPQLAPAPYAGPTHSPDADPANGVTAVLGDQLDLQRVTGTPPLIVYRNRSSQGPAVEQAGIEDQRRDALDALATDRSGAIRFDLRQDGPARWTGAERPSDALLLAVPADGWSSETDSVETETAASGFVAIDAASGSSGDGQEFAVSYPTPTGRRLATLAQLVLAGGAVVLAQTRVEDDA